MIKVIFVLMTSLLFLLSIDPCRARNDTGELNDDDESLRVSIAYRV